MGVEVLVQIDRLVQLLETPSFNFLRLQLLHPARYPALLWRARCPVMSHTFTHAPSTAFFKPLVQNVHLQPCAKKCQALAALSALQCLCHTAQLL